MTAMPGRLREPSATEAIYIKTGTQVVSRCRVDGQVSEAQFNQALELLEARYVILRAALWDGYFVVRPAADALRAEWLTAGAVQEIFDRLLDTKLDLATRLYSAHVVAADDGMDVFLLTSHSITDATSLVELHSFLIHFCDCVARGETPEIAEQAFPDSIDGTVAHCLAALGGNALPPRVAAFEGIYLRLPANGNGKAVRNRVHRIVIEPTETARVIETAHRHGVSLHAILVAGFALAIKDMANGGATRILMRASVDLRRRLEPHLSVELVCSAVTAHVTVLENLQRTIFEIAQTAFADLHPPVKDGRVFRDYENYPKSFGDPHAEPVAVNISDMGPVRLHCGTGDLPVTGFEYGAGLRSGFPNVSITVFGGRLVATMIYNEAVAAKADVERLAQLVVERLVERAE